MILTEVKTEYAHYFKDEDDKMHGLYQSWYGSGEIWVQIQYNHGKIHGEYKFFNKEGSVRSHTWCEHDKPVLNFLVGDKYPTTKEELLIFKLTYQGEFIPR